MLFFCAGRVYIPVVEQRSENRKAGTIMAKLNRDEFRDRVLGCWTGKNIGGTLGAPFEGTRDMVELDFYTQDLGGDPLPNDDLDLQLIWLYAAEELGVYHITPRRLAEYWMNYECAPMGEYRNCMANIAAGFYPPLSGSCNNDQWRWSNGAWIRSEVWACFFPGFPDEAARCACIDACCDHEGEGIWAEVFTASLEAAAFVEHDIRRLIGIALDRVSAESRIAKSIRTAVAAFDEKLSLAQARERLVEVNTETGFFQAPLDVGFLTLALLYGEGDFEKTVLSAVRCGDDTDCTAATAGAVLGIILGRSRIPEKWCAPIGNRIVTKCLAEYGIPAPRTLDELTDRVTAEAERARSVNPALLEITDSPTDLDGFVIPADGETARLVAMRSPYEVSLELPFARIGADLAGGPEFEPGVPKRIRFVLRDISCVMGAVTGELLLPEGWQASPCRQFVLPGTCLGPQCGEIEVEITPAACGEAVMFLPVRFTLSGRKMPEIRMIPLQRKGCVCPDLRTRNGDKFFRRSLRLNERKIYPKCEFSF